MLLLLPAFVFGQQLPNEKTKKHVQISGTNIFMIPPPSFQPSKRFKGFQSPTDQTSMIMVLELPAPFLEASKGFTSATLSKKGMQLKDKKEIKVGSYDALLIALEQQAHGFTFVKQILIYGDHTFTVLINGASLKDSPVRKKIKKSILTTFVDTKTKANPREALDYSLNEKAGSLQLHSVVGNAMLFNRDLKTPTQSKDKATLIADKSYAQVSIKDKKAFCLARLKKYPNGYSLTSGIDEVQIDNLKGFQLFAQSDLDPNETMYQVILFDNKGGYYIFVGTYVNNNKKAFYDIRNIIRTFKRKG